MKTLRQKSALVTGAASGIGRAIALELARQGANLWLIDVDEDALETVGAEARKCGVVVVVKRCDLRQVEDIGAVVEALHQELGGVDILVNNAGIMCHGATEKISDEQWHDVLAVNLDAPIALVRQLLPSLLQRPESHILNVCSIYGLAPKRRLAAYVTAKFGLVGLSQSLRLEYGPRGLGVTALCPGVVRTDLIDAARRSGRLMGRLNVADRLAVAPERVAVRAVRAIRKNQGLVVFPMHARALWFLHRGFPRLLDRWQHWKRRPKRR